MRIGFFMSGFAGGGVERLVATLATGFQECGHKVDVVVAAAKAERVPLDLPGARPVFLGVPYLTGDKRVVASTPLLMQYIRRSELDALFATPGYASVIAPVATLLSGTKTRVIPIVDNRVSALSHASWHQRMMIPLSRIAFRFTQTVVTPYEGAAQEVIERLHVPRQALRVIPHPVDIRKIKLAASADTGHPWLEPGRRPFVLGVGRLHPIKNFCALVRAMRLVLGEVDARLIILGDGPDRDRIAATVRAESLEGHVQLLGFRDPYPFMERASVLALPSSAEAYGLVLVEALALGTPVVATAVHSGGPQSILENGRYGALVPVGDVRALANAIIEAVKRPPNPDFLKRRAANFDVQHVSELYCQVAYGN